MPQADARHGPAPNGVIGAIWLTRIEATDREGLGQFLARLPAEIAQEVRGLAQGEHRGRRAIRYSEEFSRAYLLEHAPDGVLTCYTCAHLQSREDALRLWA